MKITNSTDINLNRKIVFGRIKFANTFVPSFGYDCFYTKLKNKHCPYCDVVMLTPDQFKGFQNSILGLKSKDALKQVIEKTKGLKEGTVNKKVAKLFINALKANPNKTVRQVIRQMVKNHEPDVVRKQVKAFAQAYKLSENLPPEVAKKVKEAMPEPDFEKIMALPTNSKGTRLKKGSILYRLRSIERANKDNQEVVFKIQEIADLLIKKLPEAKKNSSAFITKYANRSDKDFVGFMVLPLLSTADHIYTRCTVGSPGKENYLAVCYDCNNKRGNKHFDIWVKENPKFFKLFPKYLKGIDDYIRNLKLEKAKKKYLEYKNALIITVLRAISGEEFEKVLP